MTTSSVWKPGEFDGPTTLVELLRVRAAAQAGIVGYTFLVDGETERDCITYSQLDLNARAVAACLQKAELSGQRALLF